MQMVRVMLLFIYGLPLLIGVWWLVLFNRKSVKTQFVGAPVSPDTVLPRKPACPLPITVLAVLYISSLLNLLFLPLLSFRVPLFLFGRVIAGPIGVTVLILNTLAFAVAGIGLLKLKPWSYSFTLGLQVFWIVSSVVSVMNKNYGAVMDSYMKDFRASIHLPETPYSTPGFTPNFTWMMIFGLLFAAAILAMLVYYRPRFLDAASRAASAPIITSSAPPPA